MSTCENNDITSKESMRADRVPTESVTTLTTTTTTTAISSNDEYTVGRAALTTSAHNDDDEREINESVEGAGDCAESGTTTMKMLPATELSATAPSEGGGEEIVEKSQSQSPPPPPTVAVDATAGVAESDKDTEKTTTTTTTTILQHQGQQQEQGRQHESVTGSEVDATLRHNAGEAEIDQQRGGNNVATTTTTTATITTLSESTTMHAETTQSAAAAATSGPVDQTPQQEQHLMPHTVSEPTFGVQLRRNQQQQQQKIKDYHDTRQAAVLSTDLASMLAATPPVATLPPSGSAPGAIIGAARSSSSAIIKCGTVSASASPSMLRRTTEASLLLPRRVSFPKSDDQLVTGYCEPANPWEHANCVNSISEIAELYVISCQKHNTAPLQTILDHLRGVELNSQLRQPLLSLKSIKLASGDCEALEEVFKRVRYKCVDLSSCDLDEVSASALFEMIEYYEAATELDISANAGGMVNRGWNAFTYMVHHSQSLQTLNAQGNPISKLGAESLGHAINNSNLHTIKLEHCGLKGAPLNSLCYKLRNNKKLKELWMAYNDLDCKDAENIADLLKVNPYLELIDISNNDIRDEGVRFIVLALIVQSKKLEEPVVLKRVAAIDDDDFWSPVEPAAVGGGVGVELASSGVSSSDPTSAGAPSPSESEEKAPRSCPTLPEAKDEDAELSPDAASSSTTPLSAAAATATPTTTAESESVEDDDTEETTTMKSSLKQHCPPPQNGSGGGQSMLDKLLSMNSEGGSSSSDDSASNLSTDTIAACCSEDASIISDDIFDANAKQTSAEAPSTAAEHVAASLKDQALIDLSESSTGLGSGGGGAGGDNSSSETTTTLSNNNNSSSGISHNNNNSSSSSNNNNNNNYRPQASMGSEGGGSEPPNAAAGIFEVTAEERDCLIGGVGGNAVGGGGSAAGSGSGGCAERLAEPHGHLLQQHSSRALDMNKNATKQSGEDYDDTHSTDSAFESASEGDISRHLLDEFGRLSSSFESTRLDADLIKDTALAIETATIATESTECLLEASTPTSTPTSPPLAKPELLLAPSPEPLSESPAAPPPKVTIAAESLSFKLKESSSLVETTQPVETNLAPTPPPPAISPGGASHLGLRRTESSVCGFMSPATRNRSHSSDSLCGSDTSLDGGGSSVGSGSTDLNFSTSALTKNDTLTRQQRQQPEPALPHSDRAPGGLKALALWNNNLTKEAGYHIADLLADTASLELLNIGKNCLSNDFVCRIRESLTRNTTLTTFGLQSAHLSAKGIETLSSILTFGGNSTLQRIDIRDNKIDVEGLTTIAEVLKSNTTIMQIDIDDEPKRLSFEQLRIVPFVSITPPPTASALPAPTASVGSDAHLDYTRVLENVRSMCSRNEKTQTQLQAAEKSAAGAGGASAGVAGANGNKRRGGYYLGSRKISLTCHSRPLIELAANGVGVSVSVGVGVGAVSATASAAAKLDASHVKRKTGVRLRSPMPSPPTVSPSSSPNRSRFQVCRVVEATSPLTSPLAQTPSPSPPYTATCSVAIPTPTGATNSASGYNSAKYSSASGALPTSSSLPAMASVTSSTQSIKRLSMSPRSRFHVSKIYEDPGVPMAKRSMPPLSTPPLNAPPTPLAKRSHDDEDALKAPPPAIETKDEDVALTTPLNGKSTVPQQVVVVAVAPLSHSTHEDSTKASVSVPNNSSSLTPLYAGGSSALLSSPSPSSASSSSSSTSPASLASSSSASCSPTPSTASSGSSASPAAVASGVCSTSNTDSSDGYTSDFPPARCPLAIFNDNDITLTKNSANSVLSDALAAAAGEAEREKEQQQQAAAPQRVRKVSWIANPSAVDKLRTIFHNPGTIFARSSSPETTTQAPSHNQCECNEPQLQQLQQQQLVSTRKQSPLSWTKLGADILSSSCSVVGVGATPGGDPAPGNASSTTAAAAAAAPLEQTKSFLDAASRQFRDFSKQVFRQNLSFGNEPNAPAATAPLLGSAADDPSSLSSSSSPNDAAMPPAPGNGNGSVMTEHDATHIPSAVKQAIKENISPQQTINEETLHTFHKLCCSSAGSGAASAGGGGGGGGGLSLGVSKLEALFQQQQQEHDQEAPCKGVAGASDAASSSSVSSATTTTADELAPASTAT